MDDLELYTTDQLITELLNRKTFLGVVIQSDEDFKEIEWQGDKNFKVRYNNNLGREEVSRLLDVISSHIQLT